MIEIKYDDEMTKRQRAIVSALNFRHKGSGSAITQNALAAELEVAGHVMQGRTLRNEIRYLRLRFFSPIAGSYSDGYYVAQSAEDLEKNRETVRHHGRSLLALSGAFKKSSRLYFSTTIDIEEPGGQATMPLS